MITKCSYLFMKFLDYSMLCMCMACETLFWFGMVMHGNAYENEYAMKLNKILSFCDFSKQYAKCHVMVFENA